MHHVAQDPPPTIFQRHQVRIEEVPQQRLIGSPSDPADGGQSGVGIAPGVPFISDADLDRALLEAGVPATTADAVAEVNANGRIEALRVSLAVLAVLAAIAIFLTRLLPTTPAGRRDHDPARE